MRNNSIVITVLALGLSFMLGYLLCLFAPSKGVGGIMYPNGWLRMKMKTPSIIPFSVYRMMRITDDFIIEDGREIMVEKYCSE